MTPPSETLILRTKLHAPKLDRGRVVRDRLLQSLDEHADCCLTLVSAPAGYGKSCLISEWIQGDERAAGWVSLDDADNELRSFLRYVVAAVQSLFPDACATTLSLLASPELAPARHLANELDAIEKPLTLVLDDYHEIKDAAVQDFMCELLRHPPANVHWVVATHPFPWLRCGRAVR